MHDFRLENLQLLTMKFYGFWLIILVDN